MSQKVYILGNYTRDKYEDLYYDAELEPKIESATEKVSWDYNEDGIPPREKIIFNTTFKFLNAYEYLDNDCGWKVVSQRMLDAIRKLKYGERVAAFPVTMIDSDVQEFDDPRHHSESAEFDMEYVLSRAELHRDDFWVLKIPILKGAFDKLESNYSVLPTGDVSQAAKITRIEKHVLIEPPDGYPPIFRIKEYLGNVFVTEELRQAWKEAGVRGPVYRPLHNTWLTYEMDFPVEIDGDNIWSDGRNMKPG
jgi:hypothetical protein